MTEEKFYWEKCPECGQLGRIDEEQKDGKVSIICSCGAHYYKEVSGW